MWLSKTWNQLVFLHVFLSFYVHIQIFFSMSSCKPFADILEPVSGKNFFSVVFLFYTSSFPCRIGVAIRGIVPAFGMHLYCLRRFTFWNFLQFIP